MADLPKRGLFHQLMRQAACDIVRDYLEGAHGNRSKAARWLGIHRNVISNWVKIAKKIGIKMPASPHRKGAKVGGRNSL